MHIRILKKTLSGLIFSGINKKYGYEDDYIQRVLKIDEDNHEEYITVLTY